MYLTVKQQVKHLSKEEYLTIKELCHTAKNLANEAIYNVRQYYFTEGEFLKYEKNYALLKNSPNYKSLNSNMAQQILKEVESIRAKLVGTKNTKYSNVKKLALNKSKYTVKVGQTAKIKASVTLVNKNKKHLPKKYAAKFRYRSSDTSIATVSKNGKIKGIRKGTCTIYVYSINGLTKKAQITVK